MKKMKMLHLKQIGRWSASRISLTVFYTLMTLAVCMFALFYTIGFDTPYVDNPDVDAPLFTGALVIFVGFLLAVTVVVTVVAAVRSQWLWGRKRKVVNGIHVFKISMGVSGATITVMLLSFACVPASVIMVNGKPFSDGFWLRMAEMFVDTSIVLLVAAVIAVVARYVTIARRHRMKS